MRKLSTPTMKKLLQRGRRQVLNSKIKRPSDGFIRPLFVYTRRDRWYYQIDYIYDTRRSTKPYVIVYAFRPSHDRSARSADYYLYKDI